MSGLSRYLAVLRLLGDERPHMTVPEIAQALNTPTSSVYRTVRELLADGFLEASVENKYRLGPAIIEFDRRVRLSDPLIRTGERFLPQLAEQVRVPCLVSLCRLYGETVMCIADFHHPAVDFVSSYERGRPMPLLRGATSKIILAYMPTRKLQRLLRTNLATEEEYEAVKAELAALRRVDYCITRGEVDPGLLGIAAPIHDPNLGINASITVIAKQSDLNGELAMQVLPFLVSTAKIINDLMSKSSIPGL